MLDPAVASVLQAKLKSHGFDPGSQDGIAGAHTFAALFSYVADFQLGANGEAFGRGAVAHFPTYGITTPLRIAHWLAQAAVESGNFRRLEESLNYSAQRLCAVWPHRFPNLAAAQPYAGNQEKLADFVYGGRMGNTGPHDGFNFRGRGAGLTGRENYTEAAQHTGLDLVNHPELAAEPENLVFIFSDFWSRKGINALADDDDVEAVTRAVNGGVNGLADREAKLARAKAVL